MRGIHTLSIVIALVCATGCGKKDKDKGKGNEGDPPGPGTAAKPDPKPAAPATTCPEKHELAISFSGKEHPPAPPAGPFDAKHAVGFVSGMSWSGGTVTKIAYVVLANYPVKVETYTFDVPRTPEKIAVQLTFSSKAEPATLEQQKAVYAALALAPGAYPFASSSEAANLGVSIWVGDPEPTGKGLIDGTGGATITTFAPDRVCGTIDVTSPPGITIKGTFNVALEKDLWAN
jgi:hypothetical protein